MRIPIDFRIIILQISAIGKNQARAKVFIHKVNTCTVSQNHLLHSGQVTDLNGSMRFLS